MTKFRDQSFDGRIKKMGDLAERAFERACREQLLWRQERIGWDRPNVSFSKMPPAVRYLPDYWAEAPDSDEGFCVEVMGLGRDGLFRGLKLPKYQTLLRLHRQFARVSVFIYNSHLSEWVLLTMDTLSKLVKDEQPPVKSFEVDGNRYYEIKWSTLVAYADLRGRE